MYNSFITCVISFRVPPADDSRKHHTFNVFDKKGYNLEQEVSKFCIEHSLDMRPNGPCCDILSHAKHQQHMIRVEKSVDETRSYPHFGICMPTYQRPYDLEFLLLLKTSLPSVLAQSYTQWTLILVGDALTAEQEAILFRQLDKLKFPPAKLVYRNLPLERSEKYIFSAREVLPCFSLHEMADNDAWCHSGTGAVNYALDIAETLPDVTYVLKLSDDDTFSPNHLANLVRAFRLLPDGEIKFAFTQGYSVPWSWVGFPLSSEAREASFVAPTPCNLFDISASWAKSLGLRWRLDLEQSAATRRMQECCGHPCHDGIVLPNDADFFERVNALVTKDKLFYSVFIPQIDLVHIGAEDRLELVEQLKKDYNYEN